jgi:hypothetical protein
MRDAQTLLILALTLGVLMPACGSGGGDGGGDDDGGGEPAPQLATVFNTKLAVAAGTTDMATIGGDVLVRVSEPEMGRDLNSDGDIADFVVHLLNPENEIQTNLRLATVGTVHASDTHFAFLVSETHQATTDLNGDFDTSDSMWFVYDPRQPMQPGVNPRPTGVVTGAGGLPAAGTKGGFLFIESETASATDHSGDNDFVDNVAVRYDTATFTAVTTGLVYAPASAFVARAGRVLFVASELLATKDLNADGDKVDLVLQAVDFVSGPRFVGVGPAGVPRSISINPYALTDDSAAYLISEQAEGLLGGAGFDANADGDITDNVIATFHFGSGAETIAIQPFACDAATGIGTSAKRVLFGISERNQQPLGTDMNSDFDVNDVILAFIDTALPATIHTPLGPGAVPLSIVALTPQVDGTRGIVAVNEAETGFNPGTDFNGDADTNDPVAFLVDVTAAPGVALNLGQAIATVDLRGQDALIGRSEIAESRDLNGDSDLDDVVVGYLDLSDATPSAVPLGTVIDAVTFVRFSKDEVRIAAIMPEGQSPLFGNLNGDDDSNDRGLVLLGTNPELSPPAGAPLTPFFAGTASPFPTRPLLVGTGVFAFVTSEAMDGNDLNEDGDKSDTVLQYLKYNQ